MLLTCSPITAGLQLFVCVGILAAFAIGLPYDGKEAFVTIAGTELPWWRVMLAIGSVPAALQVCPFHTHSVGPSTLCTLSCVLVSSRLY